MYEDMLKGAQVWDIRRRDFYWNQACMGRWLTNLAKKSKKFMFGSLYYPLFPGIFALAL